MFQVDSFTAEIVNMFGILLSFGVVFPPLGVVIAASLISYTLYYQLLLGRYVELKREKPADSSEEILRMQKDASSVGQLFRSSVWVTVPYATVLYAFLLFDTLGDQVGYRSAVWIPIVACCIPILMWLLFKLNARFKCIGESVVSSIRSYSTGDVPMTSLASLAKA